MCFKRVYPNRGTNHIAAETCFSLVIIMQRVVAIAPIIWNKYHTVHTVHTSFGITDATGRIACIEDVIPLAVATARQGAPCVDGVAAVAYRVVAPVGLAILVVEVVGVLAVGVIVAMVRAGAPWLVAHRAMVVAARSPAEEVNPAAVGLRDVAVGITNVVILVGGKTPSVGARLVLQVALRKIHLVAVGVYGEQAIYCTRRNRWNSRKVCHQGSVAVHRKGIVRIG